MPEMGEEVTEDSSSGTLETGEADVEDSRKAITLYYCFTFVGVLAVMLALPNYLMPVAAILHEEGVCIIAGAASLWLGWCLLREAPKFLGGKAGVRPQRRSAVPGLWPAADPDWLPISGVFLGTLTFTCLVLYFTTHITHLQAGLAVILKPVANDTDLKMFLAGECLWQMTLTSTCFTVAFVVLSDIAVWIAERGTSWARFVINATVLMLYFGMLPYVNVDRKPFPFQPEGCPPKPYYLFSVYAGCVAISAIMSGSIAQFGFNGEDFQIWVCRNKVSRWGQLPSVQVHVSADILGMIAALLSTLYLMCLLHCFHGVLAGIVYHIAWTYLRPAYTMLFLGYVLKVWPQRVNPAYLAMSFFGALHFGVLGPLADTHMSHMQNKFCDQVGLLRPYTDAVPSYSTYQLGVGFHGSEAVSFLFSMLLFAWRHPGKDLDYKVTVGMLGALLVNCVSRAISISKVGWFSPEEKNPPYPVWAVTRYFLGYGVIMCICLWRMLRRPESCVYVQVDG